MPPKIRLPELSRFYQLHTDIVEEVIEYYDKQGHFPDVHDKNGIYKDLSTSEIMDIQFGVSYYLANKLSNKQISKYRYFITFTLKPESDADQARNLVYGLKERKESLGITKLEIVEELTKEARPHWHALIHSTKCIKTDRFNAYTKRYGHIQIKPVSTSNDDEIINYINKESESVQVI